MGRVPKQDFCERANQSQNAALADHARIQVRKVISLFQLAILAALIELWLMKVVTSVAVLEQQWQHWKWAEAVEFLSSVGF